MTEEEPMFQPNQRVTVDLSGLVIQGVSRGARAFGGLEARLPGAPGSEGAHDVVADPGTPAV